MEPELIKKIEDLSQICSRRGQVTHTDFLDMQTRMQAEALIKIRGLSYVFCGGYEGAERSVLFLLPDGMDEKELDVESYIGAVLLQPTDKKEHSHREYLGSVMALGLSRDKLGDIAVRGNCAYAVAFHPMVRHMEANLMRVSGTGVRCRIVSLDEIEAGGKEITRTRCTVSSLRADSVVSAVFRLSRAKAVQAIESGLFYVNWTEMLKPDRKLMPGDMISLRGSGRARIGEETGVTGKGRVSFYAEREK